MFIFWREKMLSLILSFDKKPTLSKKQEHLTYFENIFTNQKHGNSKMFYQILTNLETFWRSISKQTNSTGFIMLIEYAQVPGRVLCFVFRTKNKRSAPIISFTIYPDLLVNTDDQLLLLCCYTKNPQCTLNIP